MHGLPYKQAAGCCPSMTSVTHVAGAVSVLLFSCSAAASLTSLAALAAYKRQLYLGLDPTAAAGALGPGANRPISAAPLQAAPAGRNSFTLKSRPNGEQGAGWEPQQCLSAVNRHSLAAVCSSRGLLPDCMDNLPLALHSLSAATLHHSSLTERQP